MDEFIGFAVFASYIILCCVRSLSLANADIVTEKFLPRDKQKRLSSTLAKIHFIGIGFSSLTRRWNSTRGMMCSLNLGLRPPQVWHVFIHYSLVHAMISGLVVEGAMAQSTRSGLASGLCRPTIRHFFSWSRFCSISMCSIRSVFFCGSASNKKTPATFLIALWLHNNQIQEFLIVS